MTTDQKWILTFILSLTRIMQGACENCKLSDFKLIFHQIISVWKYWLWRTNLIIDTFWLLVFLKLFTKIMSNFCRLPCQQNFIFWRMGWSIFRSRLYFTTSISNFMTKLFLVPFKQHTYHSYIMGTLRLGVLIYLT